MTGKRPWLCCFYGAGPGFWFGWGGQITSPGVTALATMAEELGIEAQCFNFSDTGAAQAWFRPMILARRRGGFLGYSLGVSALTDLLQYYSVDMAIAIAGSTLGRNYNIQKARCKRSRGFYIPGSTLSGWGPGAGFDELTAVTPASPIDLVAHLAIQSQTVVTTGCREEFKRLVSST